MKLLILHASAGNGHRRAGEALVAAATAAGHDRDPGAIKPRIRRPP